MIYNKSLVESITMVEGEARVKELTTTQANNGLEEIIINRKYADQGVWIGVGLPRELKKGINDTFKRKC